MNWKVPGIPFVIAGLLSLFLGLFMGTMASFQFLVPGFFDLLPFFKSRPLHVSLVVSWIFLCAVGGIYYYLPKHCELPLFSKKMVSIHLWMFMLTGIAIVISYVTGKFGGREYWEFPPYLAIPIIISWIIFGINFFKTTFRKRSKWPVYLWMWGTGIFFFLLTFLEANAWIFSGISENIVREITIQWKAYGALVGSWNMLVYGTAIFLMTKISEQPQIATSKTAFFLYFLGLSNLLFGWAHHTYFVPSAPWIRHFAYAISMTELIVLGRMIWQWKSTVNAARKHKHLIAYRFLIASDVWIFLNLILAILISIPAINLYTHGTHITVAHAMGSTIGINTMILLASVFFILQEQSKGNIHSPGLKTGIIITNVALLVFWISLTLAGYTKGILTIDEERPFYEIMAKIQPYLIAFSISGVVLFTGLTLVIWKALSGFYKQYINQLNPHEDNIQYLGKERP